MAGETQHYVACLDLKGRSCLVVGDGAMAREKVDGLRASGAIVNVVAPQDYRTVDLDGNWLVIAATSDDELNRRISAEAKRRRIFCNIADVPDLCSFILPAVHRIDPIAVAVSTGGASPALAQRLRSEIAAVVGPEHARLARELRDLRPWAREHLATYQERKSYFEQLVTEALS